MIGLDSGWRALPDGKVEFILQIAPNEVEIFKQEKAIQADIPEELPEVRCLRVEIGNDVVPREKLTKPTAAKSRTSAASSRPDLRAPPAAAQSKSPFSALTSLWDRYPLPRNASDPTDRPAERDDFNSKKTGVNREPLDRKTNEDPPFSGDRFKSRSDDLSRPFDRVGEEDRQRRTEASSKQSSSPSKQSPSLSNQSPPASTGSFTVVVLVLLGSLGGNVYMGWITWETRARYHALVRRRKKGERHLREDVYDTDREAEEE